MIKQILIAIAFLGIFFFTGHAQGNAFIYDLKMGYSKDSVKNVTILTVSLKMKRMEALSTLEVELGKDSVNFSLYIKSLGIVQQEGNYYLVADDIKFLVYGSMASVQFIIPNDLPLKMRFAKVYGKQGGFEGSNILYYQF